MILKSKMQEQPVPLKAFVSSVWAEGIFRSAMDPLTKKGRERFKEIYSLLKASDAIGRTYKEKKKEGNIPEMAHLCREKALVWEKISEITSKERHQRKTDQLFRMAIKGYEEALTTCDASVKKQLYIEKAECWEKCGRNALYFNELALKDYERAAELETTPETKAALYIKAAGCQRRYMDYYLPRLEAASQITIEQMRKRAEEVGGRFSWRNQPVPGLMEKRKEYRRLAALYELAGDSEPGNTSDSIERKREYYENARRNYNIGSGQRSPLPTEIRSRINKKIENPKAAA